MLVKRQVLVFVVLTLGGILVNFLGTFGSEQSFHFAFGSIASFLVYGTFGGAWAMLATLLIAAITLGWDHPLGFVMLLGEMAWLWALRSSDRLSINFIPGLMIYWLMVLGVVLLLAWLLFDAGFAPIMVLAAFVGKMAINALGNACAVMLLWSHPVVLRLLQPRVNTISEIPTLRQLVMSFIGLCITVIALISLRVMSENEIQLARESLDEQARNSGVLYLTHLRHDLLNLKGRVHTLTQSNTPWSLDELNGSALEKFMVQPVTALHLRSQGQAWESTIAAQATYAAAIAAAVEREDLPSETFDQDSDEYLDIAEAGIVYRFLSPQGDYEAWLLLAPDYFDWVGGRLPELEMGGQSLITLSTPLDNKQLWRSVVGENSRQLDGVIASSLDGWMSMDRLDLRRAGVHWSGYLTLELTDGGGAPLAFVSTEVINDEFALEAARKVTIELLAVMVGAVVLLIFGWYIASGMSQPLEGLVRALSRSGGNLEGFRLEQNQGHVRVVELRALRAQVISWVREIREVQEKLLASQLEAQTASLREQVSEQNFKMLVDTANAPIFALGSTGIVEEWNAAQAHLTQINRDDALGRHWQSLPFSPQTSEHLQQALAQGLSGEDVAPIEYELSRHGQSPIFVAISGSTRRDVHGQVVGVLFVGHDLTEQRATTAQLIQSSKMATLGEMATGMAHELNQPLNVIRMAAGNSKRRLVKGTAETDYLIDKLDRVMAQTERAAVIIDHLRTYGRQAGAQLQSTALREPLQTSSDLLAEQLRLDNITLALRYDEHTPTVIANVLQLEQVIVNLVTNAKDAIRELGVGEGHIDITCMPNPTGGARIEVSDNGGGLPEEVITKVFDPFFTTKDVGKGTGLGLSISYGIIEGMGGSLTVRNLEAGACFRIDLRAAQ